LNSTPSLSGVTLDQDLEEPGVHLIKINKNCHFDRARSTSLRINSASGENLG
jgi:hypothetical protein